MVDNSHNFFTERRLLQSKDPVLWDIYDIRDVAVHLHFKQCLDIHVLSLWCLNFEHLIFISEIFIIHSTKLDRQNSIPGTSTWTNRSKTAITLTFDLCTSYFCRNIRLYLCKNIWLSKSVYVYIDAIVGPKVHILPYFKSLEGIKLYM